MLTKLHGAEGRKNTRESEALMDVKRTKEKSAGQIGFCSLLILEAHLQNSSKARPGGLSAARSLEK